MTNQIRLAEAIKSLPTPDGRRSETLFQHGTLTIKMYAPRGTDPQQPHAQEEIYVVASGGGQYVHGSERTTFAAGDVLFAPAGQPHRFENFSDDFFVWVFFYGPEGGEKDSRV